MASVFVGWVPCVSGRLSFSFAGKPTNKTKRRYVREQDYLSLKCIENRNICDGLFERNGNWFGLGGRKIKSDTKDIYFVLNANGKKHSFGTFRNLKGQVLIYSGKVSFKNDCIAPLDAKVLFVLKFKLQRNGICLFTEGVLSNDIIWNSHSSETLVKEHFVEQCYFFLREMLHRHKHHDPSTDTITRIYKCEDSRWRRNIAFDLARYAVKYKEGVNPQSYYNSLGTLAYLSAFQKAVSFEGRKRIFDTESIGNIKSSLEVEKARKDQVQRNRFWLWSSIIIVTINCLNIFYQYQKNVSDLELAAYCFSLVILFFSALIFTGFSRPQSWNMTIWLEEMTLHKSRNFLATSFLISAVILLIIGIMFLVNE